MGDRRERIRAYEVSHVLITHLVPEKAGEPARGEERYGVHGWGAVGGNDSSTAKILGISRTTLYKTL